MRIAKSLIIPFSLLLAAILSYGLLIPWLGFYWDDWPAVLASWVNGPLDFPQYLGADRPLSAWLYIVTNTFLGQNPLGWQIFNLVARWLCALSFWWMGQLIWPGRTRRITWMAFLFLLYPGFLQQSISWVYSHAWIIYALTFFSHGVMVLAIRDTRRTVIWTIIALLSSGLCLLTTEYFAGLELIRPIIIWIVLKERNGKSGQIFLKTLARWSVYLIPVLVFVLWRFGIYGSSLGADDPNRIALLGDLVKQPIPTIVHYAELVGKDLLYALYSVWTNTLRPDLIDIGNRFYLFSWGIAILVTALAMWLLCKIYNDEFPNAEKSKSASVEMIIFGLAATIAGGVPVWATDRSFTEGIWADRFILASMPGVCIFLAGLISWFTLRRLQRVILVSVLLGLATGANLRVMNNYRWQWSIQQRFYWQLKWRAPTIKPGTAILMDDLPMSYVADYSIGAAINAIYAKRNSSGNLGYWFFEVPGRSIPKIEKGREINYEFRSMNFVGSTSNAIVLSSKVPRACLWVLDSSDKQIPDITERTQDILPLSDLGTIEDSDSTPADQTLLETVFGPEPEHTWCYYFEKADLAKQSDDWETVKKLGDEADALGFGPHRKAEHEYFPFIEGNALAGDIDKAVEISEKVLADNPAYQPALCDLWKRIQKDEAFTGKTDAGVISLSGTVCEKGG